MHGAKAHATRKKDGSLIEAELAHCRALVIDSNPTSRSIMTAQLRDYGVGTVVQSARVLDARRQLEHFSFDVVLCEHHFHGSGYSGQDLLDDLRRAQLLPFSTVFVMVTGEASYAKVAEAAESALDSYLLKPFSPASLIERIRLARYRKTVLQDIFIAIEQGDFGRAAVHCVERFQTRGPYWLYAARIGAELLLRLQKHDAARKLFESVIEAKALPWAKLGVARAQLDGGHISRSITTIQSLIGSVPDYADAYDVLGRAQVDSSDFESALATYKTAATLTPSSVSRVQKFGMLAFYLGHAEESRAALSRAVMLGLDSKMFDYQTLLLLALSYFEAKDRKGLQRCRDDIRQALDKDPKSARVKRLNDVIQALVLIDEHQVSAALDIVRQQLAGVDSEVHDFEASCNLLSLLAQLAERSIQLDEVEHAVDRMGTRFCTTRALSELLASAARAHAPYAERIRGCQGSITALAEQAMALSMGGYPAKAVEKLLQAGEDTFNAKLIDMAHSALQRYADALAERSDLSARAAALRERFGSVGLRANIGRDEVRQPGALSLRTTVPPPPPLAVDPDQDLSAVSA